MPQTLDAETVRRFVPERSAASKKGQNGRVLVVGGGTIYHGAPVLTSLAALRAGCDLVYTAVPKHNVTATRSLSPNLIVIPIVDQKLTRGAVRKLLGTIPLGIDSAAIGMGLAVAETRALELLISSLADAGVRILLDAGALHPNVLSLEGSAAHVLLPHAGEYTRLFGAAPPEPLRERVAEVERNAAQHSVIILLKGQTDIISDGRTTFLCEKRAPAMTVGGTGDVLSGITASIMARNHNALEAAAAAAFINATAGTRAQERLGLHLVATDLIDELPSAMAPLDRCAQ